MKRNACFSATLAAVVLATGAAPRAQQAAAPEPGIEATLKPTSHPQLPSDPSQLWLAPDAEARAAARGSVAAEFAQAVKLEVDNNFARALPMLSQPAQRQGALGHYAEYY